MVYMRAELWPEQAEPLKPEPSRVVRCTTPQEEEELPLGQSPIRREQAEVRIRLARSSILQVAVAPTMESVNLRPPMVRAVAQVDSAAAQAFPG